MRHFIYVVLLILITASCGKQPVPTAQFRGVAFSMAYHIRVEGPLSAEKTKVLKAIIRSTFEEIDQECNHWNQSSLLSQFNAASAGEDFYLTPHLKKLFKATDKLYQLSCGRFDPTLKPQIDKWKSILSLGQLPEDEGSSDITLERCNWRSLQRDEYHISKPIGQLQIDFDGILKGYTIDLLMKRIKELGFKHIYVEWAGDLAVAGGHPEKRPWVIALEQPFDNSPATYSLYDGALATSGTRIQTRPLETPDKKIRYFTHIMDRSRLRPFEIEEIPFSISVVAPKAIMADGLATSYLTFKNPIEREKWQQEIEQALEGIKFISATTSKTKSD